MTCKISEITIGDSMRALTLENDILSTTVLVDKGADIYELVYKPLDMDVMWKSPWGMKQPGRGFLASFESESAWLEAYAGGWQVLFPNGGDANIYKGAHLSYHGEASMRAWDWLIISNTPRFVEVHLSTRLLRTPWTIERFMSLEAGSPVLHIRERVKNHAGVEMDCMWSHHPGLWRALPQPALPRGYWQRQSAGWIQLMRVSPIHCSRENAMTFLSPKA